MFDWIAGRRAERGYSAAFHHFLLLSFHFNVSGTCVRGINTELYRERKKIKNEGGR